MSVDIAVVPVAGLGTRLLPATKSQPKEMLPVGRKPVVQYVVEELAAAGMQRLLFVTGPGKASIENHFDVNGELVQLLRENGKEELLESLAFERARVQYFYTRQRQALGLGHAVLSARAFVGNVGIRSCEEPGLPAPHGERTTVAHPLAGTKSMLRASRRRRQG